MSDDAKLIAEIADAHKAVSRMIIDGTLAGWTDSAHAAHRDRAMLLRMLDDLRVEKADALEGRAAFLSACEEWQRLCREAGAREARLREYVQGDARCPCCTKMDVCLPDCTFSSDSPEGFERVELARAALASEVKSP